MKFSRKFSGFTLIELLVVIAIIGLLSTLAIVALGTARSKSRDARRLSDLKQIQTALEMYNNETGNYPTTTSTILLGDINHACLGSNGFNSAGACTEQYISFPKDPSGGYYTYSGSGTDYLVSAVLEGSVNNLSGAIAVQPNAGINNSYNSNYGLILWWKFDEGSGSVAADSSNRGLNGTWNGTQSGSSTTYYAPGKVGTNAGFLNGSDNYIITGNVTQSFPDGVTMSAWVNMQQVGTEAYELVRSGSFNAYIYVSGANPTFNMGRRLNSVPAYLDSYVASPASTYNAWHHVAWVYKSGFMGVYIDGTLRASTNAITGDIDPLSGQLRLNERNLHKGYVDDLRIYTRVLSEAEIISLYNSQK